MPFNLDNYTCIEVLGEGTFGRVWRAFDNVKNTPVAIKIFDYTTDVVASID